MRVVFYDPYKPRGYDKSLGAEQVETLEELVSQSLVLSLHCPLTSETRGMIDKRLIGLLPRGGFIVNTARGGILDTSVLADALKSGALAGVGIDVLEKEPPPDDDPLVSAWKDPSHPAYCRAVLNPHSAYYSEDSFADLREKVAMTCRRALEGLPLYNVIN
jgi:D-3-phosphoglycerate dehydrogenase/C-terminal binding protein